MAAYFLMICEKKGQRKKKEEKVTPTGTFRVGQKSMIAMQKDTFL